MANDNNKSNELVAEDDDPTAELEIPGFASAIEDESDANTFSVDDNASPAIGSMSDLQAKLTIRDETISRLQFDIEQLQTRRAGLEAEINARETQTDALNVEISDRDEALERKEKLIRQRDKKIRALKQEIRERDEQHRSAVEDYDALKNSLSPDTDSEEKDSFEATGSLLELDRDELITRLKRSERYADSMRQQLQDIIESSSDVERERDQLRGLLASATDDAEDLTNALNSRNSELHELKEKLESIEELHAEEIRILRFELGSAQDTIVEAENVNSQLASDLVDTRSFKDELEQMLDSAEEASKTQIDSLQKQIGRLKREAESYEQKLNTKSEAITVLLAELAKKSEQLESIDDIEEVIHDIDDRIAERIEIPASQSSDRTTRLLVGTVDGQLLRFPLFKDRLTIGRTEDNDIQLKAAYISRRHAVIQTDGESARIIDWGSKNGVFVNGGKVKEHFLDHGDAIIIGNARFRYEERKKRDA